MSGRSVSAFLTGVRNSLTGKNWIHVMNNRLLGAEALDAIFDEMALTDMRWKDAQSLRGHIATLEFQIASLLAVVEAADTLIDAVGDYDVRSWIHTTTPFKIKDTSEYITYRAARAASNKERMK